MSDDLFDLIEKYDKPAGVPDRARWRQAQMFSTGPEPFPTKGDTPPTAEDERLRVAHSPVAIKAHLEDVGEIFETGDLRTQHETQYSGGMFAPDYRAQEEDRLFPDRPGTRPVYGYVDLPQHEDLTRQYGEMKYRLKNSVKDRSTVMLGDSLDAPNRPANLQDVASGRSPLPFWAEGGAGVQQDYADKARASDSTYYETQIHSPNYPDQPLSRVPLSEVSSVDVDWAQWEDRHDDIMYSADEWDPEWGPEYMDKESRRNLGAQFAEHGIPVWHTETKTAYQPPITDDPQFLKEAGFRPAMPNLPGYQRGDMVQEPVDKEHAERLGLPHRFAPINWGQFREQRHQKDY